MGFLKKIEGFKKMTSTDYAKFIKENSINEDELRSDGIDDIDSAAYEMATHLIKSHPEVAAYLKSIGVKDLVGRLADDL